MDLKSERKKRDEKQENAFFQEIILMNKIEIKYRVFSLDFHYLIMLSAF
jgi:hypothetical protein